MSGAKRAPATDAASAVPPAAPLFARSGEERQAEAFARGGPAPAYAPPRGPAPPGRPIPEGDRVHLERRAGFSLASIRIQDDTARANAVRTIGAEAVASGDAIALAPGAYAPGTAAGRALLAHEVAHNLQQRVGPPRLRMKGGSVTRLWFQEAVDELKLALKHDFPSGSVPMLRIVLKLAWSIDNNDQKAIASSLNSLVSGDARKLPKLVPSGSLIEEMHARLLLQGMSAAAAKLRTWHTTVNLPRSKARKPSKRKYSTEVWLFDRALDFAEKYVHPKNIASSARALKGVITTMRAMRDEHVGLDPTKLKQDRAARAKFAPTTADRLWSLWGTTISVYADKLIEMIRRGFRIAMRAWQPIFERALDDLQSGRTSSWLGVLESQLKALDTIVYSGLKAHRALRLGARSVKDTTRSAFGDKKGKHFDFFLGPSAKKRTIGFKYFDREIGASLADEKDVPLDEAIFARRQQLRFLRYLYGQPRKGAKITPGAKENKAAIQSALGGKMRLHSDDDWRKFALAKFNAAKARLGGNNASALRAVIKLLHEYLAAFTVTSSFNIEDFGKSYLNRSFPRDLMGRLIHDCGVYALRLAYILSLVRKQLKLRFRFIALPLHVGLVITGEGLPTMWVIHNKRFVEVTPGQLAEFKKKWLKRTKATKLDEPQFVGEVAARSFTPRADTPFKLVDVPGKGPQLASPRYKHRLWNFYDGDRSTFGKVKLFKDTVKKPGHAHYQFDVRYLHVMRAYSDWHNKYVVRYWSVTAPAIWRKHAAKLLAAHAALLRNPTNRKRLKTYEALAVPYMQEVFAALDPLNKAWGKLGKGGAAVTRDLRKHRPGILAKGTRIQPADSFGTDNWVHQRVWTHIRSVQALKQTKGPHQGLQVPSRDILPPFMDPGQRVWPDL